MAQATTVQDDSGEERTEGGEDIVQALRDAAAGRTYSIEEFKELRGGG